MKKLKTVIILSALSLAIAGCKGGKSEWRPTFSGLTEETSPAIRSADRGDKEPCHIFEGEITDTTVVLPRDTVVTLNWIFKHITPVQNLGRPDSYAYYIEKLPFRQPKQDSISVKRWKTASGPLKTVKTMILDDVFNSSIDRSQRGDTLYLLERINNEGLYDFEVWREIDKVYRCFNVNRQREYEIILFDFHDRNEYKRIMSWQKERLKEDGRKGLERTYYRSNTASRCVSRIVTDRDSVRIDMFKYDDPA